jgi:hypothetical protein
MRGDGSFSFEKTVRKSLRGATSAAMASFSRVYASLRLPVILVVAIRSPQALDLCVESER